MSNTSPSMYTGPFNEVLDMLRDIRAAQTVEAEAREQILSDLEDIKRRLHEVELDYGDGFTLED